jgi:aryl-alcohol dehydrogenase-like predicted oxidoreductase
LGSWATFGDGVDFAEAERVTFAALDAGINLIDTAPNYAGGLAEEWLGRILATADHGRVVVSTKAFFAPHREPGPHLEGLSRKALFQSVDGSLRRLRLGRIDLLYCHRFDPDTPLEETLAALGDLRRLGKINAWGVSRWPLDSIRKAVDLAAAFGLPPPAAAQEPYNRLYPAEARNLAERVTPLGVQIVGYSLMARGVLTGKYLDRVPEVSRAVRSKDCAALWQTSEGDIARIRRVVALAQSMGVAPAALIVADGLRHGPCNMILTAATSAAQVADIARGMKLAGQTDPAGDLETIFDGTSG